MRNESEAPETLGQRDLAFDPASGELTGPAGTVRIAPQPASLLGMLLERRGDVVSRDEIVERLWPGGKVEFEQGIAFALREIRKGLEGAGYPPTLVETIPRRGYRLSSSVAPTGSSVAASEPVPKRSPALAAMGIALVAAAVAFAVRGPSQDPVFAVFQHDPAEAGELLGIARVIGSSMTTVLTDSLAGIAGIVGPTGTASLSGPNDLERARRELAACIVLSGSISPMTPDSVVVFTQMVRTADGVHVWARLDTVQSSDAVRRVTAAVLDGAREAWADC